MALTRYRQLGFAHPSAAGTFLANTGRQRARSEAGRRSTARARVHADLAQVARARREQSARELQLRKIQFRAVQARTRLGTALTRAAGHRPAPRRKPFVAVQGGMARAVAHWRDLCHVCSACADACVAGHYRQDTAGISRRPTIAESRWHGACSRPCRPGRSSRTRRQSHRLDASARRPVERLRKSDRVSRT